MSDTISISRENKRERLIETWQLFLILALLSIIISILFQKFIMTRDVYYNLYSDQLEENRIDDIIDFTQKLQIWGYIAIPIITWLRLAFITFLLQLPLMIKFIEIPFRELFRIITFAFSIMFVGEMVRFLYLYFLPTESITLNSLTFIPLSITNFLDKSNYPDLVYSILSKINLFEFLWCYVIYAGLYKTNKLEKIDAVSIIFGVWVSLLLIVTGFTFFTGSLR